MALTQVRRRQGGNDPYQVVQLARSYTQAALRKLYDLMNGEGGSLKQLDKNGNLVETDIEVPAAVQAKCAEIIIERGYGKAPQAIMLGTDGSIPITEKHLSVAEKILKLKEAAENPVRDLEASEQSDPITLEAETENVSDEETKPASAEDMI